MPGARISKVKEEPIKFAPSDLIDALSITSKRWKRDIPLGPPIQSDAESRRGYAALRLDSEAVRGSVRHVSAAKSVVSRKYGFRLPI